jgi:hypothetical protein
MSLKVKVPAMALAVMVSLAGAAVGQTTAPGTAGGGNNANATTAGSRNDDRGFDWGWLGLIGLAGLAGLSGRSRRTHAAGTQPVR